MNRLDNIFMREAIKEAVKAFDSDEVPVGAVIVLGNRIIARAHNQIKLLKDPTAHAEMIAITQAASYIGSERLINTVLYSTVEPCSMCAGAMVLARIKRLVYSVRDPKTGAVFSATCVINNKKLNHRIIVSEGILSEESSCLLREFFRVKRQKAKADKS